MWLTATPRLRPELVVVEREERGEPRSDMVRFALARAQACGEISGLRPEVIAVAGDDDEVRALAAEGVAALLVRADSVAWAMAGR